MREHRVDLYSPAIGSSGQVICYGHFGRPVLVFPSEQGKAYDFANNGMVGAVADLIEAGRVKLYCVDSYDAQSWARRDAPLEQRAQRHEAYESWIVDQVVAFIAEDSKGAGDIITTGCSMGAFHALNFAFRRADLFPLAMCFSGNYDPSTWHGWGNRGDAAYFNNPADYIGNLHGDHLEWLRSRVSILLVCGQGQWEDTTGSLASTKHIAGLLDAKGIRCQMDLWGYDVPHDWPSWRAQWAHHLPRFC